MPLPTSFRGRSYALAARAEYTRRVTSALKQNLFDQRPPPWPNLHPPVGLEDKLRHGPRYRKGKLTELRRVTPNKCLGSLAKTKESHVDRRHPSTRTKQQSLESTENWLKSQFSGCFRPIQGKNRKQFTLPVFCPFLMRPDIISPAGLFPSGVKLKRTRQIGRLSEYGMTESADESPERPHSLSLSLKYIATILGSVAAAILPHSLPMRRISLPETDRDSE